MREIVGPLPLIFALLGLALALFYVWKHRDRGEGWGHGNDYTRYTEEVRSGRAGYGDGIGYSNGTGNGEGLENLRKANENPETSKTQK